MADARKRLGERVLDVRAHDCDVACDWTTGSFMLVRRDALRSAGFFDERFFLYSEDLCFRIKQAGWEIRHLLHLTILHAGKDGWNPRLDAQAAFAKRGTREREHRPETELEDCANDAARLPTPAFRCAAAGGGRARSRALGLSACPGPCDPTVVKHAEPTENREHQRCPPSALRRGDELAERRFVEAPVAVHATATPQSG